MKKKFIALSLIFVLVTAVLGLTLSGCVKVGTPDYIADNYENLAANAEFSKADGYATVKLDGVKKFNTVALSEDGDNVTSFELYVGGNLVYANDRIGNFRYCALSATYETDELTVKITGCDSSDWELSTPQIYLIDNTCKEDFSVTSYIIIDKALRLCDEDRKIIGATTQFNLISSLYLLSDGSLRFKPQTLSDGTTLDGEAAFRTALANIREMNPQAEIVATILGNEDFTGDGLDQEERHDKAMTTNSDALVANVLKVIDDYSLDGIAFDYEYPHNLTTNRHYGKFIEKLKLAMPEGKQLNCAFSLWNLTKVGTFPRSKLKYVDHIELMAYDGFDEYGDHSSFYTMCAEILAALDAKGIDLKKVNLGLPFYSRPADKAAYWGDYYKVCDKLGIYGNKLMQTINVDGKVYDQLCYYNSRQLIYDKTAYAIDAGAGGVMIWHYGCDTTDETLSLYGAISQAIADRSHA